MSDVGTTSQAVTAETARPPAEKRLGGRARAKAALVERSERQAFQAAQAAERARAEVAAIHEETSRRFGLPLPLDPFLLDVLDSIVVEPGDKWRWQGIRNNKGLPTLRWQENHRPMERSLVRWLAIRFGVITEDDCGTLYPVDGDTDDVNPWHRVLRRHPMPACNPNRYAGWRGGVPDPTD